MRVLIVGGSGYLGQFLLKHLLESPEDDVIAVGYTYADETTGSIDHPVTCLLYTSPSPRDGLLSRMPSSA